MSPPPERRRIPSDLSARMSSTEEKVSAVTEEVIRARAELSELRELVKAQTARLDKVADIIAAFEWVKTGVAGLKWLIAFLAPTAALVLALRKLFTGGSGE